MEHHTPPKGLSNSEVLSSREKFGENLITPRKKESLWKLFLEKFEDPIVRILIIAAALSLVTSINHGEYAETFGIFIAIVLATAIAFWFEMDAQSKFNALNKVTDFTAVKVIRNGLVTEVPKSEIVVGDIVIFETGEEIPADGRILECNNLLIDESSLTGEPSISKHSVDDPTAGKTYPTNMLYRSTKVLEGNGMMEVMSVGDSTEYGKVAQLSTEKSEEMTPLARQLDSLAKLIGACGFTIAFAIFNILLFTEFAKNAGFYSVHQKATLIITLAAVMFAGAKVWLPTIKDILEQCKCESKLLNSVLEWSAIRVALFTALFAVVAFGVAYLCGVSPLDAQNWIGADQASKVLQIFMIAVTLIVVSVPEGLPMSVTLSLALSMRKMLKTNNLVRKMHACETMGATTVICTDKTGTLTQNQMQVKQSMLSGESNLTPSGELGDIVAHSIALNTTAFLERVEGEKTKTIGNPTEAALLLWCDSNSIDFDKLRNEVAIVERINFSTERKYMATLVDSPLLNRRLVLVKGAPEIVLARCSQQCVGDNIVALSDTTSIESSLKDLQSQAMRTLGFAYKVVESQGDSLADLVEGDLIYIGHFGIADPIREDVPPAVGECLRASIGVKIVTGDTYATAREIGRQIGLWQDSDGDESIIAGVDFEALSDDEAQQRAQQIKIMCRARPADKQRLVALLQRSGEVVAVTGDGTNDAPALNRANVGLSMGTGTTIAKEASDITLLDDSFSSIVSAVVWGRSLYLNIQRFILFQLSINLTAMVIVLLGALVGTELPLTVTQMLWVNLIMDTFAAGALASLPADRKVLNNPPRNNNSFIISRKMALNIVGVSVGFIVSLMVFMSMMDSSIRSLTIFFTTFVLLQFWNMFNAKAFDTHSSAFKSMSQSKSFLVVSLLILVGQYLIVTYGGEVFRTVPLSGVEWISIFAATSVVLWVGEILRFVNRR